MSGKNNTTTGLTFAFWLNFGFAILELFGGILTNSTAILADALHDGIDVLGIGIAVILEKIAHKRSNNTFTYGYKRFSLLSSLIIAILLLIGVVFMSIQAIESFFAEKVIHTRGMLGLAVLGFVVNGFAFLKIKYGTLLPDSHKKHHDHNQNEKAVMLHLLEDTLGWIAVLVGAVIIHFTKWYFIDGILTLGLSIYIGYNAFLNLLTSARLFLQAIPETLQVENLESQLLAIPGMKEVHDLHVRSMDGIFHIASLHLVCHKDSDYQFIYQEAVKLLKRHSINHPTIQLEYEDQAYTMPICVHQIERNKHKK